MPLCRRRSNPFSRAPQGSRESSPSDVGTIFGSLRSSWDSKNKFLLERYTNIHTFATSAPAASSEVQNAPAKVSQTPPELPKTLPRAPREVPGPSPRPLGSGPRCLQRYLSSAWDLRSSSEAALKAFWDRCWSKFRTPSLFFSVFSFPWPLLSCLVWSVFRCFCSTLLRFCVPKFSGPFVAMEVQLLLLF